MLNKRPIAQETHDEPDIQAMPRCPSCGWRNVRLSLTKNAFDVILGMVSVQRFKCRSCGNYFHRHYRLPE
jgi:transposase-like protein